MSKRQWLGWLPGMTVTLDGGVEDSTRAAPSSAVAVKAVREERPQFSREYTAPLPGFRSMKITARTTYGRRDFSGEITQPGGRWVLFDPERVADRILDPQLVPVVMEMCREIFRLDDAFMASKPSEFVDEGGTRWQRT